MSDTIDRTHRFAKFLRAAVAVKSKPAAEVNKYPFVIWFSELPGDRKEIRSPLVSPNWPEDDFDWLVVKRVVEPERPAPPDECLTWLDGVDLNEVTAQPVLNPTRIELDQNGVPVEIPVPEDTWERFASYVTKDWAPWAEKAKVARTVAPFYKKLFGMVQALKGKEDAYDVFVGVGLLDSRADPAQRLHRHLLAFPAEIRLDEKSGSITIGPSPDASAPRVEVEFLPTTERSRVERMAEDVKPQTEALWPSVYNRSALGEILLAFANRLAANGEYLDELSEPSSAAGRVRVTLAPAVIMRPRTTRSLDELLARIEKDTTGAAPRVHAGTLPSAWRRMVEDEVAWGGQDAAVGRPASGRTGIADDRVYFPLPSNEEQSKIIRYANGSAGVVVQGPPGTGKSHTIANLISHYLASGQRVLVTAQSAQALKVLRDKMPAELQDLCVCLLGNSTQSDKDLQRSVNGILARRQSLDETDYDLEVARLDLALREAENDLVAMDRTLADARAGETAVLEPVDGYRGTKAAIARQLNQERPERGWIADVFVQDRPCPEYAYGWERLADYHQTLDAMTKAALAKVLVETPFTADQAQALIREITSARAALRDLPPTTVTPDIPAGLDTSELVALAEWLQALDGAESKLDASDSGWYSSLREDLLHGERRSWRMLAYEAIDSLAKLTDGVIASAAPVTTGNHTREDTLRVLSALSAHYAAGGRRRLLFAFKPPTVRECDWVESEVQVGGASISTPDEIERARLACEALGLLDATWAVWAPWDKPRNGSARQQRNELQARTDLLHDLLSIAQTAIGVAPDARGWLRKHLKQETATASLSAVVQRRLSELALTQLRDRRNQLAAKLADAVGKRDVVPALDELQQALILEDEAKLATAFSELDSEHAKRRHHKHYTDFLDSVVRLAPILAGEIHDAEGTLDWHLRFLTLDAAWKHRRVALWLGVVLSADKTEAVERAARDQRQKVQEFLKDLTAAKAWRAALARIDDGRRAALVAWAKAVGSIPATGLSVFRKRAVARSYLGKCLDTIPAWVVSLGRLYETVEAQPGLFDVAIVDEASQCWLDSLVLFYLAKQVIIVGDDKQISPTVVGVGDGQIADLTETYLSDFEYRGSFTIESSLFDHSQKYLSAGVPLREHFRCVPEIIRFSNELCYSDRPLIPLRSVGGDRLVPLRRTYVANALRRGDVNEREAEAVVDAIVACHQDPSYEGADFGVICLQGDAQAVRIEQLLLDRVGPAIFEERSLRCGNPYAFQGDERDVVFLSMVAAPNVAHATLTGRMYEQRFNVALSRGRDQLWLFHSVPEHELRPNCLRRRVVEFFRQPPDLTIHGVAPEIPSLQIRALRPNRSAERPPRPFDSWFEVDVALALVAKGFRLSAQVAVGRKSIDLVVEGAGGARLAVECDGDAWHGPEQHEQDVSRQRQLERVGWRFVRVRESLFHADGIRAIAEVVDAAEEVGIYLPGAQRGPEPDRGGLRDADAIRLTPAVEDSPKVEANSDEALEFLDDADDDGGADQAPTVGSGPFAGYEAIEYPDPRTAPETNVRIALLDIVNRDGPLPKESIYRLYREGCRRFARTGRTVRKEIDLAIRRMERKGDIQIRDEGGRRDATEIVVKATDQSWVRLRPAGARELEDVPLSELATAAESAAPGWVQGVPVERADVLKRVSQGYGVRRVKNGTAKRLSAVVRFATNHGGPGAIL